MHTVRTELSDDPALQYMLRGLAAVETPSLVEERLVLLAGLLARDAGGPRKTPVLGTLDEAFEGGQRLHGILNDRLKAAQLPPL